jgi:hypothetical protein
MLSGKLAIGLLNFLQASRFTGSQKKLFLIMRAIARSSPTEAKAGQLPTLPNPSME